MKSAYFMGADKDVKFEVKEEQIPEVKDNDVLIKVSACGICGTDVHIYHGEEGSAPVDPPVVLGHEFSGVVEKIGSKVTKFKVGDHVCADPNMYCGSCRPCLNGKKQNCEHLYALGVNTNGGFEEYCLCPENNLFKVGNDIDLDVACMAEPLACAIHGIDRAGIRMGDNVLVIGGGTIGLLMIQLAKNAGAAKVLLSEPVKMRRDIALSIGADGAIDPINEDLNKRIYDYLGVDGADVVIECVGNKGAVSQAIGASCAGATVLLFSVPKPHSTVDLPLMDVYKKELTIKGSIINPDTHQRAVDMINNNRIEIKKLITHSYDLNHLEDAIKMQMSADSIKVIVKP